VRYPPARAAHGSDPSIRAGPRYQLALWAAGAGEKEPPVCAASERRANHISERRSEQPACPSCAAFPKLEASTTPPSTPLYLSSRSIFLPTTTPSIMYVTARAHLSAITDAGPAAETKRKGDRRGGRTPSLAAPGHLRPPPSSSSTASAARARSTDPAPEQDNHPTPPAKRSHRPHVGLASQRQGQRSTLRVARMSACSPVFR